MVTLNKLESTCGFPSAADTHRDRILDLNDLLISTTESTFFIKAKSNSMSDFNIQQDDLLIVDRSIKAEHGQIVIAVINGDFHLKRLCKKDKGIFLTSEKKGALKIELRENTDFFIWGVVTYSIHAHVSRS